MHGLDLILTLTGSLTAALILGYIAHRVGLSPIAGYLLAGIAVGRHTPGFVADPGIAEQLAEVGVVLLMFGVGLQLHLKDLLDFRRVVIPGAFVQVGVSTTLGALVAVAFGWQWGAATVFGLAVSVASTAVSVRVLADNRELHTPVGHIAVGWLLVEDIITVVVLVLLPALAGTTASTPGLAVTLAISVVKIVALVFAVMLVGNRAIPWLLDLVASTHSRELFTLAVLVLAVGIAVGSAMLFGVSMALGAFLAGIVVGRTDYGLRAASEAMPMRDAFGVLFFVSIGILLDPRHLMEAPGLIAAAAAVVIVGTPLVASMVAMLLGVGMKRAAHVGFALGQIGEFSFILGILGISLGILRADAMNTIVAVSIISIIVNGLLSRLVVFAGRWQSSRYQTGQWHEEDASRHVAQAGYKAVVVGYGPTGRILTRLLRTNNVDVVIIELNVETVRSLKEGGLAAVHGDAGRREILVAAGAAKASHLILSADSSDSAHVSRTARELNPAIRILARTTHLRDVESLRAAGVDAVFSGEAEVALALSEEVLHQLGATAEQIDTERERVHKELFAR